ncbi:MAG: pyridoxamine 5'-phosphate oxidase family protein [Beijerinckiaceae bacterium]|nr:pyridoxamine 5'-phosphate oxidase family protein [Beijerinckiaceae bacterium]
MAKQFNEIDERLKAFIEAQPIFFVASATAESRVNVSPKGLDCLRVLGPNRLIYLDLTGSGNETAAHLKADGRLTLMFCAMQGAPMILRLYGRGRSIFRDEPEFDALLAAHFGGEEPRGARQIVMQEIDLVQTSCGFGVPLMDFAGHRPVLGKWADAKSDDELVAYRALKNTTSMDGLPTGFREKA